MTDPAQAAVRPARKPWKWRLTGGLVGLIGFILSPLSWWNDLFVNVPLALGFGWLISRIHPSLFESGTIVGYWLTNVLGFVLLHKGAQTAITGHAPKPYSRQSLLKDLLISLLYTGVILALFRSRILRPAGE